MAEAEGKASEDLDIFFQSLALEGRFEMFIIISTHFNEVKDCIITCNDKLSSRVGDHSGYQHKPMFPLGIFVSLVLHIFCFACLHQISAYEWS